MRFVIVVALVLAGCASSGASPAFKAGIPYQTYDAAVWALLHETFQKKGIEQKLSGDDQSELISCATKAYARDVPDEDKRVMLDAMNRQQFSQQAKSLLDTWLTVDSKKADPRVERNFADICPEFLARYPDIFSAT